MPHASFVILTDTKETHNTVSTGLLRACLGHVASCGVRTSAQVGDGCACSPRSAVCCRGRRAAAHRTFHQAGLGAFAKIVPDADGVAPRGSSRRSWSIRTRSSTRTSRRCGTPWRGRCTATRCCSLRSRRSRRPWRPRVLQEPAAQQRCDAAPPRSDARGALGRDGRGVRGEPAQEQDGRARRCQQAHVRRPVCLRRRAVHGRPGVPFAHVPRQPRTMHYLVHRYALRELCSGAAAARQLHLPLQLPGPRRRCLPRGALQGDAARGEIAASEKWRASKYNDARTYDSSGADVLRTEIRQQCPYAFGYAFGQSPNPFASRTPEDRQVA